VINFTDFAEGGDSLQLQWIFIGAILLVGAGMAALPIALNSLLGPNKPNRIKADTYECGIETVGETWVQLKGQYYIFGLIFLIFDIEAVFLFPWAVAYDKLQLYMVLEGVLFILILAGGLIYAWRKGALEWV
jgi:NADH:ubiquinone oxidoreductase subunit 3 (subunit A)